MSYLVFSENWAKAWQEKLNQNRAYREAAGKWEWPLALVLEKEPSAGLEEERSVYLDLWRGECREARVAAEKDLREAPYLISASLKSWREILDGRADPILALMRGKLKLKKGNLFILARYGTAAKQLAASAAQVETRFPGETSPPPRPAAEMPAIPAPESYPRFVTTGPRGLRHDILPMRLYHKAKVLGIWNPRDIDFRKDIQDWQRLNDLEKEVLLHLTALFQAGEEGVTRELLPLIMVIAKEGHLEEEMYLTTFLWEEAKHTEFFRRFLDEVAGASGSAGDSPAATETGDITRFHSASYRAIFYEELPAAMNALLTDASAAAQIRASATYNMIVEGTLAETGYHAYYASLERNNLLPGLREGIGYLKRDESRHIAYGVYLLSRLVAADPSLWEGFEERMGKLLEPALQIINEIFDRYPQMPFGLKLEDFVEYALDQFNKRMSRIERARGQTPGALFDEDS